MMKLDDVRARHPRFCYRRYAVRRSGNDLELQFVFHIEPDLDFTPTLTIPDIDPAVWQALSPAALNNLAFHLGLIEIPSYWKATCSPVISIEAGLLDQQQIDWWHALLLNGMTEFFYVNQINFTTPGFVTIQAHPDQNAPALQPATLTPPAERVLVPIGGGKDSVVTLETLRHQPLDIGCLSLNPTLAARDIVQTGGFERYHVVRRTIDSTLLRLNEAGYLNGHTPFSALTGFLSVVCAVLYGYGRVAVSHERSSNEGNIIYHGREINHQDSKTFGFEQAFRRYISTYLAPGVDFFSFMRPLYELQITRLFANLTPYHPVFRSCNKGSKTNSWCHNCPKCLFVYTALFPFVSAEAMGRIFQEDLFARADLVPLALQMLDHQQQKPFECVGTNEETLIAFYLCCQKIRHQGHPLPPLLETIDRHMLQSQPDLPARAEAVLMAWNDQHALPPDMQAWLQQALDQTSAAQEAY